MENSREFVKIIRYFVETFHKEEEVEELITVCTKMFGVDGLASNDCKAYVFTYLATKKDVSLFADEYFSKKIIVKMVKAFGEELSFMHPMISGLLTGLTASERIDAERMEDEIGPKAYYINFMDQEIFPCGKANKYIADIMWRVASKLFTGEWPKTMPPDWKPDYPTIDDPNLPQREAML
jgi:hypothetical protein